MAILRMGGQTLRVGRTLWVGGNPTGGRTDPAGGRKPYGWQGRPDANLSHLAQTSRRTPRTSRIYRLVCSIGRTNLVRLLTRCHLPLPEYFIADEKHTHCLDKRVYLPTISCGRVIWHLGYTTAKSVSAFIADYGEFKQAAKAIEKSYQAKGILTDGFNSTKKSFGQLFPFAKLANCMLHATFKLPAQIKGVTKAVREALREVCLPPERFAPPEDKRDLTQT